MSDPAFEMLIDDLLRVDREDAYLWRTKREQGGHTKPARAALLAHHREALAKVERERDEARALARHWEESDEVNGERWADAEQRATTAYDKGYGAGVASEQVVVDGLREKLAAAERELKKERKLAEEHFRYAEACKKEGRAAEARAEKAERDPELETLVISLQNENASLRERLDAAERERDEARAALASALKRID